MYLNETEEIEKIKKRLLKAKKHQSKIVSILKEVSSSNDVDLLFFDVNKKMLYEKQKEYTLAIGALEDKTSSVLAEVYNSREPYLCNYVPFDTRYNMTLDNPFNLKINSQILLPILDDNQIVGIIRFSKSQHTYEERDFWMVTILRETLKEICLNIRHDADIGTVDIKYSYGFNVEKTYDTIDNIKKHIGRLVINNPEIQKIVDDLDQRVDDLSAYIDLITSGSVDQTKNPTQQKMRVLIADDVQMNVRILDAMIRNEEVDDITFAYDGDQTIDCIEESIGDSNTFDILFLDHHMPKKLGSEIAEYIERQVEPKSKIYIVSITNDPKAIEGKKLLYDYFVPKPFKRIDVARVISEIREIRLGVA